VSPYEAPQVLPEPLAPAPAPDAVASAALPEANAETSQMMEEKVKADERRSEPESAVAALSEL